MPLLTSDLPAAPAGPAIVVTAERAPTARDRTAATVSVIDRQALDRLGEPLLTNIVRLFPSTAVAQSGPAGSITEVRIRGAEANHTLLFVDGIRANDPAAGNAPRFELLGADLADRLELVRGPQSALWGSEAIGGVLALTSDQSNDFNAGAEAGSFGFARLSGRGSVAMDTVQASFAGGYQRATGIDSFGAPGGDRDGYRNLALRTRVNWNPASPLTLGLTGFLVRGRSEYDGYQDFVRADTGDVTRNRLAAIGVDGRWTGSDWTVRAGGSLLRSANRNLLDGAIVNRTAGARTTISGQLERAVSTGTVSHRLIVALDGDGERFKAADAGYGGATDQNRNRLHRAVTGEWRAEWRALVTDLSVRRDIFNRFKDATTLRGSVLVSLDRDWSATASYGQGIAQPTFFDLYGFFPASFIGNPTLRPEKSRGVEAGLRYTRGPLRASATIYRQRLTDEIVDVFLLDFRSTTDNAAGVSRRAGLEVDGGWQLSPGLRVSANYAFLRASERRSASDATVRELRRPRHSGSIALDGRARRWSYGASMALVGDRRDTDFDVFPAQTVTLDSYLLAAARLAFHLDQRFELFGRVANAFNQRYQDVVGYRTEGRSAYAGIRARLGS
ncbi:TonB-dependent receptor [Sphingomonas sp. BN140010]|uniref:TonB-dependent receptor n=1 Tax=Sphingomonas arvum TaxID=2992113 RepID=A0ABT3JEW6_9SPHN|nr:TonB-dependent receptor [Sphingomonas sp. BN140010]MCW3797479.1 TonB-dependent receptor [Sphingomonas sp. BN140010]